MYKISGEAGRAACFVHMKILPAIWLLAAGGSALAQQPPQNVPDAQRREGETLTERLDRTDGVIKPPPMDRTMPLDPQKNISNMPVLKPDDTPPQQATPSAGK
jgi:hypothetical protein